MGGEQADRRRVGGPGPATELKCCSLGTGLGVFVGHESFSFSLPPCDNPRSEVHVSGESGGR